MSSFSLQLHDLSQSYLVNLFNIHAPKDNFGIHKINKDCMHGLSEFIRIYNNSFSNIFDIEFLEEYDMPFSINELFDIDISILAYETFQIDTLVDDYSIFNEIYNKYKNTQYNNLYVLHSVDNCSYIYFFIDINRLSLEMNINIDDFLDGIRIGCEFEGGFMKKYIYDKSKNDYVRY